MVGLMGETPEAQSILNGSFGYHHPVSNKMSVIIKALRPKTSTTSKDRSRKIFLREKYKLNWNKTDEYTSSGVSGLHFGHWKEGCTSDTITDIHAIMSMIPYITGYSPVRWRRGIDVMTEKAISTIELRNCERFYCMKRILTTIIKYLVEI